MCVGGGKVGLLKWMNEKKDQLDQITYICTCVGICFYSVSLNNSKQKPLSAGPESE